MFLFYFCKFYSDIVPGAFLFHLLKAFWIPIMIKPPVWPVGVNKRWRHCSCCWLVSTNQLILNVSRLDRWEDDLSSDGQLYSYMPAMRSIKVTLPSSWEICSTIQTRQSLDPIHTDRPKLCLQRDFGKFEIKSLHCEWVDRGEIEKWKKCTNTASLLVQQVFFIDRNM